MKEDQIAFVPTALDATQENSAQDAMVKTIQFAINALDAKMVNIYLEDVVKLKILCALIVQRAESDSSKQEDVQEAAIQCALDVEHAEKVNNDLEDARESKTRFVATAGNAQVDNICPEDAH